MIYLIGVEHKVQWIIGGASVPNSRHEDWCSYISAIDQAVTGRRIDVVAEELNQEILNENNCAKSILIETKMLLEKRLKRKIEHLFVEPSKAEKNYYGYKEDNEVKRILKGSATEEPSRELVWAHMVAHQFPIRERFWFDKINEHLDRDILLICGDAHIDTFPSVLNEKGVGYAVIKRGIGMPNADFIESKGIDYARKIGLFGTTSCPCLA